MLPVLWWCAAHSLNNWLEEWTARGILSLRAAGFAIDYSSRQCSSWPNMPGIAFRNARFNGILNAPGSGQPRQLTARSAWLRISLTAWPPFAPILTFGPTEAQARLPGNNTDSVWKSAFSAATIVLRARHVARFSSHTVILASEDPTATRRVVLTDLSGRAQWGGDAAPDSTIVAMSVQARDLTTDAAPNWARLWPFADLHAAVALLSRSGAYPRGRILVQSLQTRTGPPSAPLILNLTGSLAPSPPPNNRVGSLDGAGTLMVDGTTEALDRGLGWLGTDAGTAAFGVHLDPSLVLAMRQLLRQHPLPADHVFVPLRLRDGELDMPVISRLQKLLGGIDINRHTPHALEH